MGWERNAMNVKCDKRKASDLILMGMSRAGWACRLAYSVPGSGCVGSSVYGWMRETWTWCLYFFLLLLSFSIWMFYECLASTCLFIHEVKLLCSLNYFCVCVFVCYMKLYTGKYVRLLVNIREMRQLGLRCLALNSMDGRHMWWWHTYLMMMVVLHSDNIKKSYLLVTTAYIYLLSQSTPVFILCNSFLGWLAMALVYLFLQSKNKFFLYIFFSFLILPSSFSRLVCFITLASCLMELFFLHSQH